MTITIKELKQRAKENGYIAFESDESLLFIGGANINVENKIVLNKKDNSILEYNVTFSGDRDFDMLAAVEEYVDSIESGEQDEEVEEKGEQLTYKELKKIAKKNGYKISRDEFFISLKRTRDIYTNSLQISRTDVGRLWVENSVYCDDADVNMIEGAVKYAKTPLNDREEKGIYVVPLPWLVTSDGEQQYLTKKGKTWFACRRQKHLKQTWKEGSLHEIPEEYRKYVKEVEE